MYGAKFEVSVALSLLVAVSRTVVEAPEAKGWGPVDPTTSNKFPFRLKLLSANVNPANDVSKLKAESTDAVIVCETESVLVTEIDDPGRGPLVGEQVAQGPMIAPVIVIEMLVTDCPARLKSAQLIVALLRSVCWLTSPQLTVIVPALAKPHVNIANEPAIRILRSIFIKLPPGLAVSINPPRPNQLVPKPNVTRGALDWQEFNHYSYLYSQHFRYRYRRQVGLQLGSGPRWRHLMPEKGLVEYKPNTIS
jgi:hypothetical protein